MLQNYVSLYPETHQYFDTEGKEYAPVSRVIKSVIKPFDMERILPLSAAKQGKTEEALRKEWNDKRDDRIEIGSAFHSALEAFSTDGRVVEPYGSIIQSLNQEYDNYKVQLTEVCLYDPDFMIAGTADKLLMLSRNSNSILDIDDYKTNTTFEFSSKYRQYLFHPLSHLQDCEFTRYALQLSAYAYMAQKLTGRKIGRLNIVWLDLDAGTWKRIPVPYMRYEIIELFQAFAHPEEKWLS